MFEKSLYDLIRGLRHHKGNEREYIQESLRECRKEIRTNDIDLKATALLKLTYLEMFGYDMSWASFNVLEVMSSPKYLEKRVGYLAAVQSFRPDTEVLMLAENLLKKDLTSPTPTTISLPLVAIPHVINPSMANSLLSDLLPRLTHSHPAIRKKTIVTLYRLALVYPETLRPAWPKIKERLQDENEDPSVTAAIVNVVCELGWRRPQDFLPLAPRLFDLLVQGGNNWMGIKIIKLFATLTPLEPRLVKKLLPPLTTIIKTTPAMSLLYECINGIVQGGILESIEGTAEGDEIARLCVGKLRGMLVVEGDPNLKYVALLAFQKIVTSHPYLVSLHQDVILECVDDADISIRMRALDLVAGMVNGENLVPLVERLLRQLQSAPIVSTVDDPANDRGDFHGVEPRADSEDEEAEESLRREKRNNQPPPLPEDYRLSVMTNILDMCSRDIYANINDFEWYIGVLVQLVSVCPAVKISVSGHASGASMVDQDISYRVGQELLNVAVRVKAMRAEAALAAQSLVMVDKRDQLFPASGNGGQGVLESAAWIVGEYAQELSNPNTVINSLLHASTTLLPSHILAVYLQAILKVFAVLAGNEQISWTPERRQTISLMMARIVYFLEPLVTHPSIEVQERAVEYIELMRLASEAANGQNPSSDEFVDPPLLLTQAIPSLFMGMELNPVAPGAQKKVPIPDDLDLDHPINPNLQSLLRQANQDFHVDFDDDDVYEFYYKKSGPEVRVETAAQRLEVPESQSTSYQQADETDYLDPDTLARKRAERRDRYKDDPFYIGSGSEAVSRSSTPLHNILKNNNGDELDIDSIPIMDLQLSSSGGDSSAQTRQPHDVASSSKPRRRRFDIVGDETIDTDSSSDARRSSRPDTLNKSKGKKSLLQVDSSGLGALSLEGECPPDAEQREAEERALREVERLRLEMQRAAERIHAKDLPDEGMVVRRKKKRGKGGMPETEKEVGKEEGEGVGVVKKKKKKKSKKAEEGVDADGRIEETEPAVKPKKRKKRVVDLGPEVPV
ncbi:Adaptor protein complex AP-3 delta subunit [Aulographum hederae CBS 113979]|uniref:AP-3 complex subunit delta n=1 Tax=Aulographum hederae CBS 113979 TaxID=1176131 RepID=A0A6G1GNQ1_9PEZI|nr:Adaptor protein complex AP-3 delta subunit [Aulographum hederae CBS 113979]